MVTCSPEPPCSSRAGSALSPSLRQPPPPRTLADLGGRRCHQKAGTSRRLTQLRHGPLKPLCSRGNPSQDHRALAACHTRPRPQLPTPQLAHRRAYPRLSTSERVASREQIGRSQLRPRPQIPLGRGVGRSLKARAPGPSRSLSRKGQRVRPGEHLRPYNLLALGHLAADWAAGLSGTFWMLWLPSFSDVRSVPALSGWTYL